jgi:hypothetical protein
MQSFIVGLAFPIRHNNFDQNMLLPQNDLSSWIIYERLVIREIITIFSGSFLA